jgi:hypothetical protein
MKRATELIHIATTCLALGGTIDTFIEGVDGLGTERNNQ